MVVMVTLVAPMGTAVIGDVEEAAEVLEEEDDDDNEEEGPCKGTGGGAGIPRGNMP